MGTIAKVTAVHSSKPTANGTTYYNLSMSNGDEINIGKKKELKIGDELSYEIDPLDSGQYKFKKAKSVQADGNSYQKSSMQPNVSFTAKSGIDTQKAIIYQNALSQANAFLGVKGYNPKMDNLQELKDTADIIAKWVIGKASGQSEESQSNGAKINDLPF